MSDRARWEFWAFVRGQVRTAHLALEDAAAICERADREGEAPGGKIITEQLHPVMLALARVSIECNHRSR